MIRRRVMVCHQTSKVPSFPGSLERCLEMKRGGMWNAFVLCRAAAA